MSLPMQFENSTLAGGCAGAVTGSDWLGRAGAGEGAAVSKPEGRWRKRNAGDVPCSVFTAAAQVESSNPRPPSPLGTVETFGNRGK